MASRGVARSIREATRFTSTTPHAVPSSTTSSSTAAKLLTAYGASSYSSTPPPSRPRKTARIPGETPEERVARLRRAHDAARDAQVSSVDKVISVGRTIADKAHRLTVLALMTFSVVCFAFTVFAIFDMLRFNRGRRREFEATIAQFKADSLEAARIAYISGTASEEQVTMVEEAMRKAEELGVKLPPLLEKPGESTMAAAALGQGPSEEMGKESLDKVDEMMETAAHKVEAKKSWWSWR